MGVFKYYAEAVWFLDLEAKFPDYWLTVNGVSNKDRINL